MAGEPAASSAAFDRMNEQEEAGSRCTMVEGIEAEVEAAGLAKNKVLKLLKGSFSVLAALRDGACAPGSGRRRLYHVAPAPFAHGCRS